MLNQYSGFIPQLYRRYIDDVVGAAYCAREDLDSFVEFISNFHPALQFTHTITEDGDLPFLDISLSISEERITTSAHYKPNDTHSYLHHIPNTARRAFPTVSSCESDVCAVWSAISSRRHMRRVPFLKSADTLPLFSNATCNECHVLVGVMPSKTPT